MTDFDDAFDDEHEPVTGGYKQVQPDVIEDINNLTRDRRGKFWIGKTSGGEEGCKGRWNNKYKADEMNKMAIVYESSSQDNACDLEEDLVDIFWERIKNVNRGGGGGWAEDNPPYVVYIAWRE